MRVQEGDVVFGVAGFAGGLGGGCLEFRGKVNCHRNSLSLNKHASHPTARCCRGRMKLSGSGLLAGNGGKGGVKRTLLRQSKKTALDATP